MRNLFLCKTPYQIIVVTQLINTRFFKDENDILVADTIVGYQELCDKIAAAGFFNNVIPYPVKKELLSKSKWYFVLHGLLQKSGLRRAEPFEEEYDRFFFCNIGRDETFLYRRLLRSSNKLELNMFEDGFASYSTNYGSFFKKLESGHTFKQHLLAAYRRLTYEVFGKLSGFYVFSPELFEWTPPCELIQIPVIDPQEPRGIELLNRIFGCDEQVKQEYSGRIIFFEEADSMGVDVVYLVEQIASVAGKSEIVVKRHPRNAENKFETLGIKTNSILSVPWEVIAMNIDLSPKILVTVASGSALTSLINTGEKPQKIYLLLNCECFPDDMLTPTAPLLRKIAQQRAEDVELPDDMGTFLKELKEELRRGENRENRGGDAYQTQQ